MLKWVPARRSAKPRGRPLTIHVGLGKSTRRLALADTIVPDFPVANKSFNLSYAGNDPVATMRGMTRKRPNPVLWLYYQYGGRLPATYRDWVLHDSTTRTWLLRVVLRALLRLAPIMAGLALILRGWLGGPWALVLGSILLGVLVYLRFALTIAADSVDSRLTRYGYPTGYGTTVRQQAARKIG